MSSADFNAFSRVPDDSSSAFTHELKSFYEHPAHAAAPSEQLVQQREEQHQRQFEQQSQPGQNRLWWQAEAPPVKDEKATHQWWQAETPPLKDEHAHQTSSEHLPAVTLHDSSPAKPQEGTKHKDEKHKEDGWSRDTNMLVDLGIAAAAIFAAEAIGAYVFRSPQLAQAAADTALASTTLGVAAGRTAFVLEKAAIYSGAFGLGVGARHLTYRALSGHNEAWSESALQTTAGFLLVGSSRFKSMINKIP